MACYVCAFKPSDGQSNHTPESMLEAIKNGLSENDKLLGDLTSATKDKCGTSGESKSSVEMADEIHQLKNTVTELSVRLTKQVEDHKIQDLGRIKLINSLSGKIDSLGEGIKSRDSRISEYESTVNKMESRLNDLSKTISEKDQSIKEFHKTHQSDLQKLTKLSEELKSAKSRLDCLSTENCALAELAKTTKETVNKLHSENNFLRAKLKNCQSRYCALEDNFIAKTHPTTIKVCESTRDAPNSHAADKAEEFYTHHDTPCDCVCPKNDNEESNLILKKVAELVRHRTDCGPPKLSPNMEKIIHADSLESLVLNCGQTPEPVPPVPVTPSNQQPKKPCFTFKRRPTPDSPNPYDPSPKPKCSEKVLVVVPGTDSSPKTAYFLGDGETPPKDCVPIPVKPPITPPSKSSELVVKRVPTCIYVPGCPSCKKYKHNTYEVPKIECIDFGPLKIQWKLVVKEYNVEGSSTPQQIESYMVWINGKKEHAISIESGRMESILIHAHPESLLPSYIITDENQPSGTPPNDSPALIDPSSCVVYTPDRIYLMKRPIFNYTIPDRVSIIFKDADDSSITVRSIVVEKESMEYFLSEMVKQPYYVIYFNRNWTTHVNNVDLESYTPRKLSISKHIGTDPVVRGGPFRTNVTVDANGKQSVHNNDNVLTKLILDKKSHTISGNYASTLTSSNPIRVSFHGLSDDDVSFLEFAVNSVPSLTMETI